MQFSPHITPGNEPFVHHIVIYVCDGLLQSDLGTGGRCYDSSSVSDRVADCAIPFAVWGVGGNVRISREDFMKITLILRTLLFLGVLLIQLEELRILIMQLFSCTIIIQTMYQVMVLLDKVPVSVLALFRYC